MSAMYSDSQIVSELARLGIEAAEAKNAMTGNGESFQTVLWEFCEKVMKLDSECVDPNNNYYIDDLPHPEMYDDSWRKYNLFNLSKDFLGEIGVKLTWMDFNEPSTAVLRKVFTTCIRYAKYVEWKEPDVTAAEQRVNNIVEENWQIQDRIDQLRREYDMSCNDLEDKELQLEGLKAQEAEEELKLSHLQEEADSQREEVAAAQKHAMSARTSLLVLEEKYEAAQVALKELRADLCEDGDELLAEYTSQRRQNQELDEQRNAEMACGRLLRRNLGVMKKTEKELESVLVVVKSCLEKRPKKKEAKAKKQAAGRKLEEAAARENALLEAVEKAKRDVEEGRATIKRKTKTREGVCEAMGHALKASNLKIEDARAYIVNNITPRLESLQAEETTRLKELKNIEESYKQRKQWADRNKAEWAAEVRVVVEKSQVKIREYGDMLEEMIKKNAEKLKDGGAAGGDGLVRAADSTVLGASEYLTSMAEGRAERLEACKRLQERCDAIEELCIEERLRVSDVGA